MTTAKSSNAEPRRVQVSCGVPVFRWHDGRYSYRTRTRAGRRTERMLKARTDTAAMREYVSLSKAAIAETSRTTVSDLCDLYLQAGCPDRRGIATHRTGKFKAAEAASLLQIKECFGGLAVGDLRRKDALEYHKWRTRQVKAGQPKLRRTVDIELTAFSNAINYGVLLEEIEHNPMQGRGRFQSKGMIVHCREKSLTSGAELHRMAAHFLAHPLSEVLAWQMYFECLTGCRTSEILGLRRDAARGPGWVEKQEKVTWLHIHRLKSGDNPFVLVTPELQQVITAHGHWHAANYPDSPFYFPSPRQGGSVHKNSLCHALQRAARTLFGKSRKLTSHGCRAFYVEWRRSLGESDAKIAGDLGHKSGGAKLVWEVYGRKPENWSGGPDLSPVPPGLAPA